MKPFNSKKFSPLVSVIIPVFNAEKFIFQTIASAINQDYENLEIIVINDNSTDDSIKIVKGFNSKKIKIFDNINQGASSARNYGISKSAGKYIQFLDADDIISKNKISSQISMARDNNFKEDILFSCPFVRFKNKTPNRNLPPFKIIDKSYLNPINWLIDSWTGGGMGQTSIWLTHKSLIKSAGEWSNELTKNQDGDFFARVIINSNKILFTDKSYVFYRDVKFSLSKKKSYQSALSTFDSYNNYIRYLKKENINNRKIQYAIAYNFYSFIRYYYPNHKVLLKNSEKIINNYNFKLKDFDKKSVTTKLSYIFGFYNTLYLKNFFCEN
tara:strand:+ start:619 stop:1599 length:981 start_codon:yes stop_codon:yes gene_type:complete